MMMRKRHLLRATAGMGLAATAIQPSRAQAFPSGSIRLLVPFAPAGTTDIFARHFAEPFGRALGQSIMIDNRGGAGGLIGAEEVRRARPDGYTLIFHSPTSGVTGPLTRRQPPFDPVTGFSHISILGITPIVLAVSPSLGVSNLREFVALVHAQPGRLSYGSSGIGGVPHLSTELLRLRAGGLEVTHVPYRGTGPAIQDLLAGHIAFIPDTFTPLLPMHREGRARIISVFDEQRSIVAPDIPTAKEEGFDVVTRIGNYLSAPPGTPSDRLERLAAAARAALSSPELKRELEAIAYRPVTDSGPAAATRFIAEEAVMWRPAIQAANVAVD